MPYLDCGGIIASDSVVADALLERACQLCSNAHASLNLRYQTDPELGLATDQSRASMLLDLGVDSEALWSRLPSERRNRIRKGRKSGLTATFHGVEGLAEFYRVFAQNMRDLGSPVHGRPFFRAILEEFGEQAQILLVKDDGLAVGAAVLLLSRDTVSIPWVSSLRSHFRKCPNQILYWEAMRHGILNGCRFLDFGRSAKGAGTYEAKRQWGAEPIQLHWVFLPQGKESPRETTSILARATNVWKRLPVSMTTAIGPWIRKGLPS